MTTRIGAAVAAGFFAIGLLVGAAGTIVVRDATTTDPADHMRVMAAAPGSMGGMAGMMSMMGAGGMSGMMGGSPMTPNASMRPADHESHHALPSPEASR